MFLVAVLVQGPWVVGEFVFNPGFETGVVPAFADSYPPAMVLSYTFGKALEAQAGDLVFFFVLQGFQSCKHVLGLTTGFLLDEFPAVKQEVPDVPSDGSFQVGPPSFAWGLKLLR